MYTYFCTGTRNVFIVNILFTLINLFIIKNSVYILTVRCEIRTVYSQIVIKKVTAFKTRYRLRTTRGRH